jgi:hypothetical protein
MRARYLWVGVLGLALIGTGCGSCGGETGLGGDGGDGTGEGGLGDASADATPCVPATCEERAMECGAADDGCGGTVLCGTCPEGEICGGSGEPFVCAVCVPDGESCDELGYECGFAVNRCGTVYDCSNEGLSCGKFETCQGRPSVCDNPYAPGECDLCPAVPSCDGPGQQPTRLTGRVITPGRTDGNTGNQVGVPNAFVYILRNNNVGDLPPIDEGIPSTGQRCDRCEDQQLGPVLAGAVTDAHGNFTIEGNIPVGVQFVLVVKAGKFRRAVQYTLSAGAACQTTALPTAAASNPTRLARHLNDGLAVHIPRIAIATGDYDAMECVFWKMGFASSGATNVFSAPQLNGRIHLYRDNGAWPDACSACANGATSCVQTNCPGCGSCSGSTSCNNCRNTWRTGLNHERLFENGGRIREYDMVISDCRGDINGLPTSGSAGAANIRTYANAGGRVFASHWSHNWIEDGSTAYSPSNPLATGLNPAVNWQPHDTNISNGTGHISQGRANSSPRIQTFIEWMVNESAVPSADNLTFNIPEPRSRAASLGTYTEEFVHCNGGVCDRESRWRPQQLAFYTPYAPPAADASCGRVVYTGYHVSVTGTNGETFPSHCSGTLSATEKTLLYLLFDLGACVGAEPQPPPCTPLTCDDYPDVDCGLVVDGCGDIINCGDCPDPYICGADGIPNTCGGGCFPASCEAAGAACGQITDSCGNLLQCGTCPQGHLCDSRNRCQWVG